MSPPPFRPLASALIRKTTLWATVCTVVLALIQGALTYRDVTERTLARLADIAKAQAPAFAEVLWTVDRTSINLMLEALQKVGDSGYAEVQEPRSPRYDNPPDVPAFNAIASSGDPRYKTTAASITVPLSRPGTSSNIGQLFLTIDPTLVYREVGRAAAAVLLSSALTAALLIAIVVMVLKRDLQRPMSRLSHFVKDLAADELSQILDLQRPPRPRQDEIDRVHEGFRLLQGRLAEHIQTLEDKVADRTAHLEHALSELKTLSTTDALTGCRNRLYFSQQLDTELQRARRYVRPLSLVFCDIDHFKQVNDQHGHAAGDQLLKATGEILRGELRSNCGDWVARYGGEEFVLVLPETSLDAAAALAERVRSRMAEYAGIPLADGSRLRRNMSFGVASLEAGETESSLLQRADQRLYEAKRGGRNRVVIAAAEAQA